MQEVDCSTFFQKFSAPASPAPLGWEVISVSGTKLSGAPSITACKFYLDCDTQHVIQQLVSEVSSSKDILIQTGKYIWL